MLFKRWVEKFGDCQKATFSALQNETYAFVFLQGEAYYKSLGYKTLIDGVIGEAEKEGRGEEVRARIEKFQKMSKMKGLATISVFIALFFYYKLSYVPPLPPN